MTKITEGIDKAIEYVTLCAIEDVIDATMNIVELCDVCGEFQVLESLSTLVKMMKDNIELNFDKLANEVDTDD